MPKLSICIPTYNRSRFLRSNLISIFNQVKDHHDVEVIVSDNASTDDTQLLVSKYLNSKKLRYYRQSENLGAIKNVIRLINDYATSEFCWIVGDDDFVMPGAIDNILTILKDQITIDFLYMKVKEIEVSEFDKYPQPFSSEMYANDSTLRYHPVAKVEKLLKPQYSAVFLGDIMASVFRKSLWNSNHLTNLDQPYLSTLNTTYPHCVVYANEFIDKKAVYLETLSILALAGARDWWPKLGYIFLVQIKDLLALYKQKGVSANVMKTCYDHYIKESIPFAVQFLIKENNVNRGDIHLGKYFKEMLQINSSLTIKKTLSEMSVKLKQRYRHYLIRITRRIRVTFKPDPKTDAEIIAENFKNNNVTIPDNYEVNGEITIVNEGSISIGSNFKANSGINHNMIGGDVVLRLITAKRNARIVIGNNVGMSNCTLHAWHDITIEDNVLIGGGVRIWDTNFHSLDPLIRTKNYHHDHDVKTAPVLIKEYAFIGSGSIILKGVTIGKNAVIAAGSVVVKDIPDNAIAGGNPCLVIKSLT